MLCLLDQGQTVAQVSANVGADLRTVRDVAKCYEENGLERALCLNQPSNRQKLLDARQLQLIKDMVCGPPPEGKSHWSIRLIAQEVVSRHVVQHVGRETIRKILKESHDS